MLTPEKVRELPARPEISRLLPAAPDTAPDTASEEPFAPVPAMVQVCGAPRTSGALMTIAPALSSMVMPAVALAGEIVRAEVRSGPPWAMVTLVMPVGVDVKRSVPTVKSPSRVVT